MSEGDRPGQPLPDPDERPCDACGHVWFAGERHHGYVDHPEDPEAVMVLCALCFRRRRMPQPVPGDEGS